MAASRTQQLAHTSLDCRRIEQHGLHAASLATDPAQRATSSVALYRAIGWHWNRLINLKMPGIAPLCLLLCIGVVLAHTHLIWLNLFCLVAYFLLYYYNLNNTLLYKSMLLCISGTVLLCLYVLLNRYANTLAAEGNTRA